MPQKKDKPPILKRRHHLHVTVCPQEKVAIQGQAQQAGLSVARYLREVGLGYPINSAIDYEQVREMARINGDLGRLGGLLKLWLTDDVRTAQFGAKTIVALLGRILATQNEMGQIMRTVVRPRVKP